MIGMTDLHTCMFSGSFFNRNSTSSHFKKVNYYYLDNCTKISQENDLLWLKRSATVTKVS